MATIQEVINKNFNDGEKELAKKIYDVLIKPIHTYIRKLEYEMEAISSRLPSAIQQADSMEVTKNGIVVIDFYAEWSMPCYELLPALETVAKEFEDVRFNPASNIQASQLLYNFLGFTPVDFTDNKIVNDSENLLDSSSEKDNDKILRHYKILNESDKSNGHLEE